jgi:hypothetical protein
MADKTKAVRVARELAAALGMIVGVKKEDSVLQLSTRTYKTLRSDAKTADLLPNFRQQATLVSAGGAAPALASRRIARGSRS